MTLAEMWVLLAVYCGIFLVGALAGVWWDRVVRCAWRRWRQARARHARIVAHEARIIERRAAVAALQACVVDARPSLESPREYPAGCAWPAIPPPATEAGKARVAITSSSPVPVWSDMSEMGVVNGLGSELGRAAARERHLSAVPDPASKARPSGVINSRPGGEGS